MININNGFVYIIILLILLIYAFFYYRQALIKEVMKRENVEEKLLLTQKNVEEFKDLQNVFLARMSHEIKTPLNTINGLSYLLENTATTGIQNGYIKKLKEASYNLIDIINDVLDFSEIENGNIKNAIKSFNLDNLLENIRKNFMTKINEKNLKLVFKRDILIQDNLIGDFDHLEQILINLIGNAVKFTDNGEVLLEVSLISKIKNVCKIKFSVSDTGVGIEKNQIENLFLPFQQLDSTITRKYDGTGLGLTISQSLVHLLGGEIEVESEINKGSSFFFTVPFEFEAEKEINYNDIVPNLSEIKVLLVDDDETSRNIIFEYLDSFYMDVDMGINFEEAKEKLIEFDKFYDLFILEINMEDSNFVELIELAKKNNIITIVIANRIHENQYEIIENLDVNYVLLKPIVSSILYNSIIQCFFGKFDNTVEKIYNINPTTERENGCILLVEDNEMNQMIEREILNQGGYKVIVANNGREAVELASTNSNIELILMDYHMPIMDGLEATKNIREINSEIPIIVMTADSMANTVEKFNKVKINSYINKPVDRNKLFNEIEKILINKNKKNYGKFDKELYLDMKQGLARIGNKEAFYYEMLEKFYNDIKVTGEFANSFIKDQSYKKAAESMHKIKGCSGNIAAIKLFQSSSLLMNALKSGIEIDIGPYLWEFNNDLKITLEIVSEILSKIEKTKKNEKIDTKHILDRNFSKVKDLIKLLKKSDLDGINIFHELQSEGLFLDENFLEAENLIKEYKFTDASIVLEKELEKIQNME